MQPTSSIQNIVNRFKPLLLLLAVFCVVLLFGVLLYNFLTFRVTKTDPKTDHFANTSSFMDIYFNKPISSDGLSITASPKFFTSYKVQGKKIRLTLTTSNLNTGRQYQVTLNHVASTSGKQITNKVIRFSPKQLDFSKSSKAQQQASINQQDQYPYLVTTIPFSGFDSLTNDGGLTSEQQQAVLQAIYDYSNKINVKFTSVVLTPGSVTPQPYNPDTDDSRTTTFTFTANKTPYSSAVNYDDLSAATITIKDQSGAVVYQTTADDQTTTDN